MARVLMEGNQALGEASIRAGCRHFFGYPITPQSEIPEYLAAKLPQVGGVYLQAESEVAAINMVFGAAGAGARVLTASSSPGISLMSEGLSYITACELPCVVINIMRGGPGLGNIAAAQSDYNQATGGIGHGDMHLLIIAPNSVQEMADFTMLAFDLADKYRNPVMVLADGILGQMMEPVEFADTHPDPPEKPWATTGAADRPRNIVNSLLMVPEDLEQLNIRLQQKYARMQREERRCETFLTDDAQVLVAAYGSCSRIAKAAVQLARARGIKAGLVRPISIWPFPAEAINDAGGGAKACLVVEMNAGQMVRDVRLALGDRIPVMHYGRLGGVVPTPKEIAAEIERIGVIP